MKTRGGKELGVSQKRPGFSVLPLDQLAAESVRAEEETFGNQGVFRTLAVLMYEVGAVARNLTYADAADPTNRRGLYAQAGSELGDIVVQTAMLGHKINRELNNPLSLEKLISGGFEKQRERMAELRGKE